MTDDRRPEWKHETAEGVARWLIRNEVTQITHHWEMTGPDTSRDWLVLHSKEQKLAVPTHFFFNNRDFQFRPYHAGLVQEINHGIGSVSQSIQAIDAWEKKNQRDRSEYERLKQKFGGK